MLLLEHINKVFKGRFQASVSEEKFDIGEWIFKSSNFEIPELADLNSFHTCITATDRYTLHLTPGNNNEITFQSGNDLSGFIEAIRSQFQFYTKGEDVTLKLILHKEAIDRGVTIYDYTAFIRFVNTLTLEDLLINFSRLFSISQTLNFTCIGKKNKFSTHTINVSHSHIDQISTSPIQERNDILSKIAGNCALTLAEPARLLPEDFFIEDRIEEMLEYQAVFHRLCAYLLIFSLYDSSTVDGDKVTYRLNGYKALTGTYNAKQQIGSYKEYYKIYKWVYGGGSLADKTGLSRNIMSLNIVDSNSLEISNNTFDAILSAHRVYEKQNIKQYIELRNKVTDQVYSFNERANKIIETFAAGFQKSALAFVTLFSTIVVTRVLTTREFNNIFSYDSTVLALVFLLGSLIYYFISLWEVNAQLKRFQTSYSNMKARNEDLLLKGDIEKILKADADHTDDCSFIRQKRNAYSILWLSFLLIFLLTTLKLHHDYSNLKPNEKSLFSLNDKLNIETFPPQ